MLLDDFPPIDGSDDGGFSFDGAGTVTQAERETARRDVIAGG